MEDATTTTPSDAKTDSPPIGWSRGTRRVVSVLLVLHLAAIFAAPCANPPPSSPLEQGIAGWFAPYLTATNLFHGYRFFAPNPGASNIVWYVVHLPDGSEARGQFPDPETHWPRLLYHRHFMMSEIINALISPHQPNPADRPISVPDMPLPPQQWADIQEDWAKRRSMAEGLLSAIAHDLQVRHDADRVELVLVRHDIADPWDVEAGQPLDAPDLYKERPLGSYSSPEAGWSWHETEQEIGVGELISP